MLQRLVIPKKIPTLNEYINHERSNKYSAASIKKQATEEIAIECKRQNILPVKKIKKITFLYYHSKRLDPDNVEFSQKFIWDGLVLAGVIPNDNLQYTPTKRVHIHRATEKGFSIEVELFS